MYSGPGPPPPPPPHLWAKGRVNRETETLLLYCLRFNDMGTNIPGESFLCGNFLGWNAPGGSLMGGNFLGGSFLGEFS